MGQHRIGETAIRRRLKLAAVAILFPLAAAPAAENPAPPCALTLNGADKPVSLDALRGQVLYVDFWASWCAPCLASFPFMNELQRSYGGRGLRVVAIDMDEKAADGARFLDRHPAEFEVARGPEGAHGPDGQCAKDFGVATMPSSFLVDRKGVVREVHKGFRPDDAEALKAKLEALLAESATP